MAEWFDILESEDFAAFCNRLADSKHLDELWESRNFDEYRSIMSKAIEKSGEGNSDVEVAAKHQFLLLLGESFEREGDLLYKSGDRDASREPYSRALQYYDQCDRMEINPAFIALRKMCVTEKVGTPEEIKKSQEVVQQTLGCGIIFMSRPKAQKLNDIIVNGGVLDDGSMVAPGHTEDAGDGITEYCGTVYVPQKTERKPIGRYIRYFLDKLFG